MKRSASPEADPASESCVLCAADVIHCHEVSVEHVDGSTACADPWCNLPHHLHEWHLACDAFAPPCPCAATDHALDLGVEIGLGVALPRAA